METTEIIIVGAGISGLVAARELCNAGKRVTVLEARTRMGGRIHTTAGDEFPVPAETGAEFIHGRLPKTIQLLKQYDIPFHRTKGEVWQLQNGIFKKSDDLIGEHHALLQHELKKLEEDLPVQQFLAQHFSGEQFRTLREAVTRFVEGYDTADSARASTFELREEWQEAQDWKQYRVEGGYSRLVHAVAEACKSKGCVFHFNTEVKNIHWKKGEVEVECANGQKYAAQKLVLTVPLGILQAGTIRFSPALVEKEQALHELGFGEIIKVLLYFDAEFWKERAGKKRTGINFKKLFFLSTDAPVTTWWTQYPSETPLLTAWLSGSAAKRDKYKSEEAILQDALASLAFIFKEDKTVLQNRLRSWKVINWSADPFTRGSYVYATVGSEQHIKTLGTPLGETLFFAGEAFAPESGIGLVEAAVASGLKTGKRILKGK